MRARACLDFHEGVSALHAAAEGHVPVAELLISKGARIDVRRVVDINTYDQNLADL